MIEGNGRSVNLLLCFSEEAFSRVGSSKPFLCSCFILHSRHSHVSACSNIHKSGHALDLPTDCLTALDALAMGPLTSTESSMETPMSYLLNIEPKRRTVYQAFVRGSCWFQESTFKNKLYALCICVYKYYIFIHNIYIHNLSSSPPFRQHRRGRLCEGDL